MSTKFIKIFFLFFCFSIFANADSDEMLEINATITTSAISFVPEAIPENTPFMLHVINKAGMPIELENSDTSVELYAGMTKTFRVGLSAGKYKFFNDFNSKTKATDLLVLTPTEMAAYQKQQANVATGDSVNPEHSSLHAGSGIGDIVFIMWRECVEALLIVGVVFGWLKQLKTGRKEGMLFLAAGVAIGVLSACVLGFTLIEVSGSVSGQIQNYLKATMTLVAAIMIVYMVKWMRTNGRTLKSDMLSTMAKNESRRWNISILVVVATAVAREGSEAFIFIYALGFGENGVVSASMIGAVFAGLGLAILSVYLLSLGNKIFSWKHFFKITEILLLLLGGAMLLNCVDLLVTAGILPILKAKLWDTSFILGDGGTFSPLLASVFGYRATPSLIDVLFYLAYWGVLFFFLRNKKPVNVAKKAS